MSRTKRQLPARPTKAEPSVGPPPLPPLPRCPADLVVPLQMLASQIAYVARLEEQFRPNLARAALVVAAVAHELPATESKVLKAMYKEARKALPDREPGTVSPFDVDPGSHETTARDELRSVCHALAKTFDRAMREQALTFAAMTTEQQHERLQTMFTNAAAQVLGPVVTLRLPDAYNGDEDLEALASRAGSRLAEVAEENRGRDFLRYPKRQHLPRVSGDQFLRSIVEVTKLSMRKHFDYADKK